MLDLGLSIVDISISMKSVYSENRKLKDSETPRVFFVRDPQWMQADDITSDISVATVPVHPDFPEQGVREIPLGVSNGKATIGIAQHDLAKMKKGSVFRLKDLANFTLEKMKPLSVKMHSVEVDEVRKIGGPIIHWIPKLDSVPVELTLIDGSVVTGLGEPGIREIAEGTFVQFERVGFAKLNEIGDTIRAAFAHK
jgi:glutamyl-tRNA synthetase